MEEKSLTVAFGDSLSDKSVDFISNLAEVGLDSIMEDGLLKEVPILSTVVSLFKIGGNIKDRHNIKKLIAFLNEINNEIQNQEEREKYKKKFQKSKHFRDEELEYLLVIIDRYIGYEKTQMLAHLYLAYLDEKIDWNSFAEYSEIVDRLLPSDFRCLFNFMCHGGVIIEKEKDINVASVLRLVSVGLVEQQTGMTWTDLDNPKKKKEDFDYYITDFGRTFVKIFEKVLREEHIKYSTIIIDSEQQ